VSDVGRFEQELLSELRTSGGGILEAIRSSGQLTDETEAQLKALLDRFSQRFS
jgi:F-type H+-transporting ATPase subunit alpha